MKIIIQSSKLCRHETKKIRRLIYTSFSTYNYKTSNTILREKMEKFYGPKISTSFLRTRFLKSEIFLIAKIDKKIVGIIRGKKNYIRNLYVDSTMLRYGIGSKLLKAFERKAKNYGSKKILLKSSDYARLFYIHQGFTPKDEKTFEKML